MRVRSYDGRAAGLEERLVMESVWTAVEHRCELSSSIRREANFFISCIGFKCSGNKLCNGVNKTY